MQGLADELGVSRATLFRHVGSREALLGKALWVLTERTLDGGRGALGSRAAGQASCTRRAPAGTSTRSCRSRAACAGCSTTSQRSTLRVLTDPLGPVQPGIVAFVEALLRRDIAEFGLVTLTEPDALAYALVRLGESFLYADVLAARKPDVATANRLQRALVEGILP